MKVNNYIPLQEHIIFSIIIPTYKRVGLLKRAIKSITNQSLKNLEVIIINDDPSVSLETELSEIHDDRIKIIQNKENRGVNYSRNTGLENVSVHSEYITFLDDDDYFTTDVLEKIYKVVSTNPEHIWFRFNRIHEDGVKISYTKDYNKLSGYRDHIRGKELRGDFLAVIKATPQTRKLRSPKYFKQSKNQFYWLELGEISKIKSYNIDAVVCEYLEGGLTDTSQFNIGTYNILKEIVSRNYKLGTIFYIIFVFIFYGFVVKYIKLPLINLTKKK